MRSPRKFFFFVFLWLFASLLYAGTPAVSTPSTPIVATNNAGLYSLPFTSREEIEEFLRTAKIVKDKMLGTGITNPHKLTLDNGKLQEYAVWKTIDERRFGVTQLSAGSEVDFKDSWKFEIAAYELDKLLGLNMVPVTVERTYKGEKGSLQIWVPNCMTEGDRLEKNMNPPNVNAWHQVLCKVRVFDALIYNIDRNKGNLLITPEWNVYMIDHSRTFKNMDVVKATGSLDYFSKSLMESLKKLDKVQLGQHCGKWLMGSEIDMMLKRRDLLLQMYDKLLAEKGDSITYP